MSVVDEFAIEDSNEVRLPPLAKNAFGLERAAARIAFNDWNLK